MSKLTPGQLRTRSLAHATDDWQDAMNQDITRFTRHITTPERQSGAMIILRRPEVKTVKVMRSRKKAV